MGDAVIEEGDLITIDGTSGNVYMGEIPTVEADFSAELNTLLGWSDDAARLGVWPMRTPPWTPRGRSSMGPRV